MDPAGQGFSPFAYAGNNPTMYVDKDGRLFWLIPVAIGAVIGGYTGYKIGEANGAKGWDMFAYIFGGAAIGGLSGYAGFAVSTSGTPFANTAGLITSSFSSSAGNSILSGRNMAGINFGIGSYSFRTGQTDWVFDEKISLGNFVSDFFSSVSFLNDVVAVATVDYKDVGEKEVSQMVEEEQNKAVKNLKPSDRFTNRNWHKELEENWDEIGEGRNFFDKVAAQRYSQPLVGRLVNGPTDHIRVGRWHIGNYSLNDAAQTFIHSDYFDVNKNWLWHFFEFLTTPSKPLKIANGR